MEFLERYASEQEADEPEIKRRYKAVVGDSSGRRQTRLRIVLADGKITIGSYSYLQEILYSNHQNLSLIMTSSVITFEGRNLGGVLDALQDDKARTIQCYSPVRYTEEPGSDEPVIHTIVRQSLSEFSSMQSGGNGARASEAS